MTTFVVAGSASKTHAAERGTVQITVSFSADDRERVRAESTAAHGAVTAEAAAHQQAGAVVGWTADRVTTDAYREYAPNGEERPLRYRSSAAVSVTFSDLAALADWVSDLSERDGVNVDGISWSLTEPVRTRLLREVRIDAVRDAITKANDYAAALDRGSPTLDAVFEEGLRPNLGGGGGGGFARDAMMAKAAPFDGGSYVLRPGDIEVSASISADFTM